MHPFIKLFPWLSLTVKLYHTISHVKANLIMVLPIFQSLRLLCRFLSFPISSSLRFPALRRCTHLWTHPQNLNSRLSSGFRSGTRHNFSCRGIFTFVLIRQNPIYSLTLINPVSVLHGYPCQGLLFFRSGIFQDLLHDFS